MRFLTLQDADFLTYLLNYAGANHPLAAHSEARWGRNFASIPGAQKISTMAVSLI